MLIWNATCEDALKSQGVEGVSANGCSCAIIATLRVSDSIEPLLVAFGIPSECIFCVCEFNVPICAQRFVAVILEHTNVATQSR